LYQTLDRVANSPYLSCVSISSTDCVDDDYYYANENDTNENENGIHELRHDQRNIHRNTLFRCGIHRRDSEDDEYEYDYEREREYEYQYENQIKDNGGNDDAIRDDRIFNSDLKHKQNSYRNRNSYSYSYRHNKHKLKHKQKHSKRNNSLYRKTMMTAATVNEGESNDNANANANINANNTNSNSNNSNSNSNISAQQKTAQQHLQKTARLARGFADDAGRAIGNLLPTASLQQLTARKYTLPDKTVASQVLMYRQLLHTKCRPGLKLSRNYEGTPAQNAVMHMPWWEEGIADSKKMIISYNNLVTRLWLNGAIEPYSGVAGTSADAGTSASTSTSADADLLSFDAAPPPATTTTTTSLETHIGDDGLPPVPHEFWVDRLGFQQKDPVTDFRSGGVLSLAMMVYMVESKPVLCQRFFTGDTSVLPFGITCINVTDMIAKFLMLAKSTDRMDALLSQKPFWKMFADPNAITAVQELAMSMLCDVAVELGQEKRIPYLAQKTNANEGMAEASDKVTVFDFSTILERTEKRVRDDLLGAGPKTVDELRSIEGRLRLKYKTSLERKIQRAKERSSEGNDEGQESDANAAANATPASDNNDKNKQLKEAMDKASNFAGGLFAKVKSGVTHKLNSSSSNSNTQASTTAAGAATIVDLPPLNDTVTATVATTTTATTTTSTATTNASGDGVCVDGDWLGTDIAAATESITNFSIGDDDDDDADLLL